LKDYLQIIQYMLIFGVGEIWIKFHSIESKTTDFANAQIGRHQDECSDVKHYTIYVFPSDFEKISNSSVIGIVWKNSLSRPLS
jgi:hypothetical protein